ncbi:fimbrial protein [Aeromonas dhakensis]|uniref:fimbrial protein n=1 Tax=Aeromonas dhakensis TaxID=196024 RepID=UPI00398889ED
MKIVLLAWLLSSTVNATSFLNVRVSVELFETGCLLTVPDEIEMSLNGRQLKNDGQSDPVPFFLRLENCKGAPSKVSVTFDGSKVPTRSDLIALSPGSDAEGFGVSIEHISIAHDTSPVTFGAPLHIVLDSTRANHELEFNAYAQSLCADGSCLKDGAFSATTTVEVTYE